MTDFANCQTSFLNYNDISLLTLGTNGNHDNNETINEDDNADDDDNWTVDTSEEAVQKRMKDLSMGVKGKQVIEYTLPCSA